MAIRSKRSNNASLSRTGLAFVTLLTVTTLASSSASAGVIALDSFSYGASGNLSGNGPGDVGFTGTWGDTGDNDLDWDVSAGSLSYPNGVTKVASGNSARLDGTSDGGDIQHRLSTSIDFDVNGTHYLSFILRKTNGGTGSDFFWAMLRDDAQSGLSMKAAFGSGSSDQPLIALNSTSSNTLGTDDLLADDIFFLARIDTVASGTDSIFLSTFAASETVPSSEGGWEMTRSGTVTGVADALNLSGGANTNVWFDEFNLGTTYASVTQAPPVPEPSTLGLALLGCLFARLRRFRKRS